MIKVKPKGKMMMRREPDSKAAKPVAMPGRMMAAPMSVVPNKKAPPKGK